MDKQRRKELQEEFMQIKTMMGVVQIKNNVNGKLFVAGFPNLKNKWLTISSQLDMGRHPNSGLQKDWKEFSRDAFEFSVLEEKPTDDILDVRFEAGQMEKAWILELGSFGEKGYNKPPAE